MRITRSKEQWLQRLVTKSERDSVSLDASSLQRAQEVHSAIRSLLGSPLKNASRERMWLRSRETQRNQSRRNWCRWE